jgi:hypothetical protein
LLDDQENEDETECSQFLVASRESWRKEMAKWIGEARATKLAEEDEEDNDIPVVNYWVLNWKLTTLTVGQAECPLQLSHVEVDAELELIQAVAKVEEDH